MNAPNVSTDQIEKVSEAFSKQAPFFDLEEEHNEILKWMRSQIHAHCLNFFKKGESILELNCGTGLDAVYFAKQGIYVDATDVSKNMLHELKRKVSENNLSAFIKCIECSFTALNSLPEKKYDHIFSDFGGLNCTNNLKTIFGEFERLLKPGGTVTLVIMPRVCPWEILYVLRGRFKTAFRRFKKNGTVSNLQGTRFMTYYYSPQKLKKYFSEQYKIVSLKGIASISPPPYMENFPKKFPLLYKLLVTADAKLTRFYPFSHWADHYIITVVFRP